MARPSTTTLLVLAVTVLLVVLPLFGSAFFVEFVMTRTLLLGLAASTIVMLSSYVNMVSLAQYLLAGVAGFTVGNCVAEAGKGLKLGLNPWLAVLIAIFVTTTVALLLGGLASRTTGIYFLMLDPDLRRHRLLRVRPGDEHLGLRGRHRDEPARLLLLPPGAPLLPRPR